MIISIIVNYRVYESYKDQIITLRDINNGTYMFTDYDNMEVDLPNTSVTSMHLKSVKARYLMNEKRYDEALDLLNSIGYDPLKMSSVQKAEIYFVKDNISKMYETSKEGFERLPLNQAHLIWYLKSLSTLKENSKIIKTYDDYKNKVTTLKWFYFYFATAYAVMDDSNREIITKQAKETYYNFSKKNNQELNIVLYYILFGKENYKESIQYNEEAKELFMKNDFLDAANKYQKAIDRFPINPDHYYNKMASLFQLNNHLENKKTFDLLPDSINPRNGKFEFLMAKSYLNIKDTTNACKFFDKSKSLNFKPTISYYKNLCLE